MASTRQKGRVPVGPMQKVFLFVQGVYRILIRRESRILERWLLAQKDARSGASIPKPDRQTATEMKHCKL